MIAQLLTECDFLCNLSTFRSPFGPIMRLETSTSPVPIDFRVPGMDILSGIWGSEKVRFLMVDICFVWNAIAIV